MLKNYKRIVVTGGCGFIGRHLVRALLSGNNQVTVVDNLSMSLDPSVPPGARLIKRDIRKPEGLAEAIEGADILFHLAGNSNGTISVENPEFDYEVNAIGTLNILEASRLVKIKRFIYMSSVSVYGKPERFPIDESHPTNPILPYGYSKLTGESFCKEFYKMYRLPVVIVRPFCVYGPGENPRTSLVEVARYLRWHLNNKPIQIVGDSIKKTRDFVHVNDLVSALIILAERAGEAQVFNVGTGEEVSMLELISMIGAITCRQVTVCEISTIQDDTYRLVADISRAKSLGYRPEIPLMDGIKELVQTLGKKPDLPSGITVFRKGQASEKVI